MNPVTIVMVIAGNGYQPIEYRIPKDLLTKARIKVVTASNIAGTAIASDGSTDHVDMLINALDAEKYDGIFLVGGPGALDNLDTLETRNLVKQFAKLNKAYGAICISPRILARARVVQGKQVTGWDDDGELAGILKTAGAVYVKQPVVVDGKLVTANGPSAAPAYGQAIIELFKNHTK